MNKTVYGPLLVALGLAAGIWLGSRGERGRVDSVESVGSSAAASGSRVGARETENVSDEHTPQLQRRLEQLASKLATEGDARRRLEERLEVLATELAALRGSSRETSHAVASKSESVATAPGPDAGFKGAVDLAGAEAGNTSMERALVTAGIDATTAAEIKRRRDALTLSEIYLRDRAAREGWLDTPGFTQQMAEIDRQRTTIRDEIGDDAYDRYLAALDQPNRVAVDEVLSESPAAVVGLQAGDVVLRYGETRIFSPSELVTATRGGIAGETVRVEIIRQGQRLQIEVPRGPLGVRIAASRGAPDEG